jgi:hypothetical protein
MGAAFTVMGAVFSIMGGCSLVVGSSCYGARTLCSHKPRACGMIPQKVRIHTGREFCFDLIVSGLSFSAT